MECNEASTSMFCSCCGEKILNAVAIVRIGDKALCEQCAENQGFKKCDECGNWIDDFADADDFVDPDDARTLCRDCADNLDIYYCESCGRWSKHGGNYCMNFVCLDCCDDMDLVFDIDSGEWYDRDDFPGELPDTESEEYYYATHT